MRKLFISFLFLNILFKLDADTSLFNKFLNPPEEAKPWTFWYWMQGAVSKEGIRADLKAMKEIGLGGAYLMPIKGIENSDYPKPVSQLTPEWWEMVRFSMQMVDSLNLQLGMHISDGFALAGGPWIKPEESMQKVVFTDTVVSGGKQSVIAIQQPETIEGYYKDLAVFAFPADDTFQSTENTKHDISSDNPDDLIPFSINGKDFRSNSDCKLDYQFDKPFTLRSLMITPSGNNFQALRLRIWSSADGVNYQLIKQLIPARHGWQNTGFTHTFSIPETTAPFFRLSWSPAGTEPGSEDLDAAKWKPTLKIKKIVLSSASRINQWEGKTGLVWRIDADKSANNNPCIPKEKIIDLSPYFNNGELSYKLPKGKWRILRMGHTSTGHTNATGGGGKGLECDKFSPQAVQKQFNNWFGAAFTQTDSILAHKTLKFMHIDSWECGSQNWSNDFDIAFEKKRHYSLFPYLPLLAGYPIDSHEFSEQTLLDVRTTGAELVDEVFFQVMKENAIKYGCELSAEATAPTFAADGLAHFKWVDRPMGEFWLNSPTHDKPNDMLDAISGAHIYGKNIIQSESFTQLRTTWNEHPGMIKPLLDKNFALGINKIFFHVFVHNPYLIKAPGMTLDGIGLYFQRNQTWWKQGKAFVDYIARTQAVLQLGVPVTDIAVFTGEEIPSRALTPDKLVDLLPGIMGQKRVESERIRLKNENQPMREMPVGVNHAANIFDITRWNNPLNGYAYDSFNKEALLKLAKAENGQLQLPGGASYKVLIFTDTKKYSQEITTKIQSLQKEGVIVPELPFTLPDFSHLNLQPDVIVPENIVWNHRKTATEDIYFLSNQELNERTFDASFRAKGKNIHLLNPANGKITQINSAKSQNDRTHLEITLPSAGSVLIVISQQQYETSSLPLVTQIPQGKQSKSITIPLTDKAWELNFVDIQQQLTTDKLFAWQEHADPYIRYYSGTVVYKKLINFDGTKSKLMLQLGQVHHLATVKVNGKEMATLWTSPYEVDITKGLKKGKNILEIEVTNTWANAIKGSDKGLSPFPGIWTNGKYRLKEDTLVESGLIGPVNLLMMNK